MRWTSRCAGLRADLQKVRTGRATPALLDGVHVDYYGSPTPINQLANMSTPDPRLIVISPYDKGSLAAIEKAVLGANLGLTPSNDGKVVRIPIPPLTEERPQGPGQADPPARRGPQGRRARGAPRCADDVEGPRVRGIGARRRPQAREKRIQTLTDEHVQKIEEMQAAKEAELLQV
jgi:ribosome recycling factor